MASKSGKIFLLVMLPVVAFAVWAYYPTIVTPGSTLVFKAEGAFSSKLNFRDAGASINACAGRQIMPEGAIFRSSGFFSGWSCDNVGNPDVIYSLNDTDASGRKSYCRGPDGYKMGVSYQHEELNDLEFLETWNKNPEMVTAVCLFLTDGIAQIAFGKSSLFHCDAGRDRTGAVIALLAAYELEMDGDLSDEDVAAIECDYRKSKSLDPVKYGRIQKFLQEVKAENGVRKFLATRCGWD